MGPLNGGWTVGKRLLQFERDGQGGNARGASFRGADLRSVDEIARTYVGADGKGRIADADLRARVADHMMDAAAMRLTVQRMQEDARSNQGPSAVTSIMKNANVKVKPDARRASDRNHGLPGPRLGRRLLFENELNATRNWLSGKAQSIYGGSNEIQSNIIAKRILGLLDHQ